jgi:hypothetical protein
MGRAASTRTVPAVASSKAARSEILAELGQVAGHDDAETAPGPGPQESGTGVLSSCRTAMSTGPKNYVNACLLQLYGVQ